MSPKAMGAVLLVLVIVLIFSLIWFHIVESIIGFIKRLFCRNTQPKAWHEFPKQKEDDQ